MRKKIFYGWWIVISGMSFIAYYSAFFAYGFTAFINPILTTFGWSMTQLSLATSLRGLETGVFNPIWGIFVDRYDPRKLMVIGVCITSIGIFILSRTVNLPMYYAGFIIMGLGGSLCTGMIQTATISKWFKKDLGKATGVYYMGPALGGLLVPLLVIVLDKLGWQATLLIAALIALVLGIGQAPVYRKRPEDYGLLPDGVDSSKEAADKLKTEPADEFGVTVKQAFKMREFWQFEVVTFIQHSILGTVTMFIIPYLTDMGLSRTTAGTMVSILTFLSMFIRVPIGVMSDQVQKKNMVMLTLVLMGAGLFIFWIIDDNSPFWIILAFVIIYGLGIGGVNVLRPPMLVDYFGSKNFGAIFGINSIAVTASVITQTFGGWIYDTYLSYKPCWLILLCGTVVGLVLMLTMPPPRRVKTYESQ